LFPKSLFQQRDVFALFFFIRPRLLLSLEGDCEHESEERTTRVVVVLFVCLFVDENIFECTWQRCRRRREENDGENQTRRTKDAHDCDCDECE
jgi:hypothetical protein